MHEGTRNRCLCCADKGHHAQSNAEDDRIDAPENATHKSILHGYSSDLLSSFTPYQERTSSI